MQKLPVFSSVFRRADSTDHEVPGHTSLVQDIANRADDKRQVEARKEQQHAEFSGWINTGRRSAAERARGLPGQLTTQTPRCMASFETIFPTFLQSARDARMLNVVAFMLFIVGTCS